MGDDSWKTATWRKLQDTLGSVPSYLSARPPSSPSPSGSTSVRERHTERSTAPRTPPTPSPSGSTSVRERHNERSTSPRTPPTPSSPESTSFWERSSSARPPSTPSPSERTSVSERHSSERWRPIPSPSERTNFWETSRSTRLPPTPPPSERTSVSERHSSERWRPIPLPSEGTSIWERLSERSTSARSPPTLSPPANTSGRESQETPWWWSPSGDLGPHSRTSSVQSTEVLVSNEQLAASVAFSAEQARKKLFRLLEHLTKERGEDLPDMLNAWDELHLDYVPIIPKKVGRPPDPAFFSDHMIEKDIQIIHTVLQTFAVLIDEVLQDQEEFKSPNRNKWMEVADTLQQLLREVDMVLAALDLPRRRVPRSAMPDHARSLATQEARDARDWLAARDLLNAVELLWYILTAFATHMEHRRVSQMRLSNTMLERYGSGIGRDPYSNTMLGRERSASEVVMPYRTTSVFTGRPIGSMESLYGGPHSHLEPAYSTSPTSPGSSRRGTPFPRISPPYPQDVYYADESGHSSTHQEEVFYSDHPPLTSLHQHNPPYLQDVYYSDHHPHDSPPYGNYHQHHPPQNAPCPHVHHHDGAPHFHPPPTTPEQPLPLHDSPPYVMYHLHHPPQNVPLPHIHHPGGAPHFHPPPTTPEQRPSNFLNLNLTYASPDR